MNQKLIIVGAGGAGCEALWVVQRSNIVSPTRGLSVMGWVDDDPGRKGELVEGLPILGPSEEVCQELGGHGLMFHCAVGANRHRQRLAELFERAGFEAVALIDPSAIVAETAQIGPGTYIGPLAVVAPHARIGRHVLVNVGASVGHHSSCGDFSQVCPGARISGHSRLAEGVFIGSNGVVAPGVSVAEWATVGAASLAVRAVPPRATALGVPAKILALPPT